MTACKIHRATASQGDHQPIFTPERATPGSPLLVAKYAVPQWRSSPESGVNRVHGRRFRFTTCKSAKEITPVPVRVSATDRIRTKIDALFAEDRELSEILEEVARLSVGW